ncbi:hypothetical protein [Desulfuromonas sp. CSMB_57]|uniref:hypothetical protein n=1 Tax=Desulfuromonas sp. CSMB_57 TaxID=2807629 RepID=UPI001CD3D252|nr:hypothetical protein [Desulfuromonas sp. CSMB_57]
MKRLPIRTLIWLLVLVPLVMAALLVAGLRSERVLNSVLVPRLERMAGARLQAELNIGRLRWQGSTLVVEELRLVRNGRYAVALPQTRLTLGLADLLARQLTALELDTPEISFWPTAEKAPPPQWPERLPVTARRIRVNNGALSLAMGETPLVVRNFQAELRGGEVFIFEIRAEVGQGQPLAIRAAGHGAWQRGLELVCDVLDWEERALLRRPLRVSLPSGQGVEIRVGLGMELLDRGDVERMMVVLPEPVALPENWDFVLRDLRLDVLWSPDGLSMQVVLDQGRVRGPGLTLPLERTAMSLKSTAAGWAGEGRFALVGAPKGTLEFRSSAEVLSGQLAMDVPDPNLLQRSVLGEVPLPVAGAAGVRLSATRQAGTTTAQVALSGRPGGTPTAARLDLSALALQAELRQQASGWGGQANLQLAGQRLGRVRFDARQFQAEVPPICWQRLRRLLPASRRPAALQGGEGMAGTLTMQRRGAGWGGRFQARAGRLQWLQGEVSEATVSGGVNLAAGRLSLDQGVLAAKVAAHDGQGRLQVRTTGHWQEGRWQARIADLQLQEVEWMSPDGQGGLVDGRLQLAGTLATDQAGSMTFDLDGRLGAGEALWGAWYAELADWQGQWSVRGRWQPEPAALQVDAATLAVPEALQLSGRGRWGQNPEWIGRLELTDLDRLWQGLARDLLAALRPGFAGLQLAGRMTADLQLEAAPDGWRLTGELAPQDMDLVWPELQLEGLNGTGRLPLALTLPTTAAAGWQPAARSGRLRFDLLRMGPVQLGNETLPVLVTRNRFRFEEPLVLLAGGGQITVADLQLGRDAAGPEFGARIGITEIDLERLTRELELTPMAGTLNADLGQIRFGDGVLSSDGEALFEVFGGRIRLRNLRFRPGGLGRPQTFADIDFQGIDLFQLTQTFEFGAINGVVDGAVQNLRLFGATPSAFSAWLETRLSGRRNISVKALNNLAIISQGGFSGILSRGLYRFIDFYRYRRIGIRCDLENDVFRLRGSARKGSDRYLVYGGWLPPRIDILAPQQPISFREMLKRLERIDRTGGGSGGKAD